MRTRQALCALAALVAALAGCAGRAAQPAAGNGSSASTGASQPAQAGPAPSAAGGPPSAEGRPAPSATTGGLIRTLPRPTGPPDNPTDRLKPLGWVAGTITTGGSGPCYSLVTDDGTRYAVHSAAGITLVKGARMRVSTKAQVARIDCGPGKPVEMIAAAPLR